MTRHGRVDGDRAAWFHERMKKVLMGCGVLLVLGLIGVGGTVAYCGHVVNTMAGDLLSATQSAATMSVDRMEQDAVDVAPDALAARIAELRLKPVRIKGKVFQPKDGQGNIPPGMDEGQVLFVEPQLLVVGVTPGVIPSKRPTGMTVEVVGIAANLNLGAMPGLDDKARAQLKAQMGSTELPVIVARKVTVIP